MYKRRWEKSYLENLEPLTNRLQLEKDLQAISETICSMKKTSNLEFQWF